MLHEQHSCFGLHIMLTSVAITLKMPGKVNVLHTTCA